MRRWRFLDIGAKYLFAAAVAAGLFAVVSTGVNADGMTAKPKAVAERPVTWSGFYFGTHTGYVWSDMDATIVDSPTETFSVDSSHGVFGGQLGIQHQWGQAVVGVEVGLTVALRDNYGITTCPNTTVNCAGRFDDVLTVGPRIGWAAGRFMPYITGGYASAAFAQRTLVPATGLATDSDRERHSGWFIGLGLDWVVAPSWILGLEYRHYDFDTAFHFAHDVFGNEVASRHTFVDPTLDSVTLRLSWKWDRPEREPPKPLK